MISPGKRDDGPTLMNTGRRVGDDIVFELLVIEEIDGRPRLVQMQRVGSAPMTRRVFRLEETT